MLALTRTPVSLETPVGDEKEAVIGDFIKDEACVLRLRHSLEDGRGYTLEEIGTLLGVTRERIRQIESKALRKLRYHETRQQNLRDFLD